MRDGVLKQEIESKANEWLDRTIRPLRANLQQHNIEIIDQRDLPYALNILTLAHWKEVARAISTMQVRGAPLIGISAAYGVALSMDEDPSDAALQATASFLKSTRPTAVNLAYAIDLIESVLLKTAVSERPQKAWKIAKQLEEEDRAQTIAMGYHGFECIQRLATERLEKDRPLQILTHCNAGRLATAGIGTALAPVYIAHLMALPVHVYVDETRPRNQGFLTAWELQDAGIEHTVIADNTGGHLMQKNSVDMVIVGADRVSRGGDVCNKIGTYLKALAAQDNRVPFYSAFPLSTVDWSLTDAIKQIPIECRSTSEIHQINGVDEHHQVRSLTVLSPSHRVYNPGFDVTPARLITGLITEKGVCHPEDLSHWEPGTSSENKRSGS